MLGFNHIISTICPAPLQSQTPLSAGLLQSDVGSGRLLGTLVWPLHVVAPIVEEIAKEFEGQIKVFKLNTDENPNVASQYGIRSIPT